MKTTALCLLLAGAASNQQCMLVAHAFVPSGTGRIISYGGSSRLSQLQMSDQPQQQQPMDPQQYQQQQQYQQPPQQYQQQAAPQQQQAWYTAVDPTSGNTYWYNIYTSETSWTPPPGAIPPPPPVGQPMQQAQGQGQAQAQSKDAQRLGQGKTKRNPDADRIVNKADVYLAMLKQDSTTRTLARHYGDVEGSNQVFADPEIEIIRNTVIDNPYVQKEKELIETTDDEMLPITMMQSEAQEQKRKQEIAEKGAATGPQYKQKLEQMKNRRNKKE